MEHLVRQNVLQGHLCFESHVLPSCVGPWRDPSTFCHEYRQELQCCCGR